MANSRKIKGYIVTIQTSETVSSTYQIVRRKGPDGDPITMFDGLNFGRAVEIYSSCKLKKYFESL